MHLYFVFSTTRVLFAANWWKIRPPVRPRPPTTRIRIFKPPMITRTPNSRGTTPAGHSRLK